MNTLELIIIAITLCILGGAYFSFKKDAVKSKHHAKTTAMMYLSLAFMTLVGIISIPEKLIEWILKKLNISFIDSIQIIEIRWMLFSAFLILVVAFIFILTKKSNSDDIDIINNDNNGGESGLNDHFIKQINRKDQEIDKLTNKIKKLKEKLKESDSEVERIQLSEEINQLQRESDHFQKRTIELEKKLNEYSKDVDIVSTIKTARDKNGNDGALEYLESIDFNKVLENSIESAKALSIQAELYALKNNHIKARETFQNSVQLHRFLDNTLSYANYLYDQNDFDNSINQLLLQQDQINKYDQATILVSLANAYQKNNNSSESQKAYEDALVISRELAKTNPEVYLPSIAMTLNNLGVLYNSENNLKKSKIVLEEALNIRNDLVSSDPETNMPHLAMTLNNLANLYGDEDKLDQAEIASSEALKIYLKLANTNPEDYMALVAITLNNLAVLYAKDKKLEQAKNSFIKALEINRDLINTNPSAYMPYVAGILQNLANIYFDENEFNQAETAFEESLKIHNDLANVHPKAFGLKYANSLVMSVALYKKNDKNLVEAKKILQNFKGIPRADELLASINDHLSQ